MTAPFGSGVRVTTELVRREKRMWVLQKVMKIVVAILQDCELKGFVPEIDELVE